jgi:hypothetical protein
MLSSQFTDELKLVTHPVGLSGRVTAGRKGLTEEEREHMNHQIQAEEEHNMVMHVETDTATVCRTELWKADTIGRVQTMYQASGSFERNAPSVSADVSEVDDQFATELLTAAKPAEQQVSEEELLSFFEQALSDRMQAISACSTRVSGSLTQQPYTTGDARDTRSVDGAPLMESLRKRGGAGMWPSLPGHRWQRSIILASLALLLLLSGFDLMGVLVLLMR